MGNLKAVMERTNLKLNEKHKMVFEAKNIDEYDFYDKFRNLRYNKGNKDLIVLPKDIFNQLYLCLKSSENILNTEDKDLEKMFRKDAKNFAKEFNIKLLTWIENLE